MLESSMIAALRTEALPLAKDDHLDTVMDLIGDASLVLLGEAVSCIVRCNQRLKPAPDRRAAFSGLRRAPDSA